MLLNTMCVFGLPADVIYCHFLSVSPFSICKLKTGVFCVLTVGNMSRSLAVVSQQSAVAFAAAAVAVVVGNTYQKLPESTAKLNRKGTLKKVHDWVLYVDVVQGDHNLIEKVEFEMDKYWKIRRFTCTSPVKVSLPDGSKVMRFKTRQQTPGPAISKITILGRGGTTLVKEHSVVLKVQGRRKAPERFIESQPVGLQKPLRLPDTDFGIELELSCANGSSVEQVAGIVRQGSGVNVSAVHEYARAHDPVQGWKLVHDGSIVCSEAFPNCSRFELVSPILRGEAGLTECSLVIECLQGIAVSVNKSMGFHVHISVEGMGTSSLKKICQNFVKYEDVIDTFMPPSRRTGSAESNQYCKSNKEAVGDTTTKSNLERNQTLVACGTTSELCSIMNPTGRYYKFNLQNLATGRQPTVEFRQHSGTSNFKKISAWVRLCMAIVTNSARFKEPSALKQSRTMEEQFDMLFDFVIKDGALRDTFHRRQTAVLREDARPAACCNGCSHNRGCDSTRRRLRN